VLRWRIHPSGNNAIEFGVVPHNVANLDSFLHQRALTGVASQSTMGTCLPAARSFQQHPIEVTLDMDG
jgi:hypothetical protein